MKILSIPATELLDKIDHEKKVIVGDDSEYDITTVNELVQASLVQLSDHYIRDGKVARAVATLTVQERAKRNRNKDMQPAKRPSVKDKQVHVIRDDHGYGMGFAGKVVSEEGNQVTVRLDGGGSLTTHRRNVR